MLYAACHFKRWNYTYHFRFRQSNAITPCSSGVHFIPIQKKKLSTIPPTHPDHILVDLQYSTVKIMQNMAAAEVRKKYVIIYFTVNYCYMYYAFK